MLQSYIFCLIPCMSTFCIKICLNPPWFSPSQHVFPTSPTLGQVASPFVRSLCSQEVNIIEDIFYPSHLHIPNLLEFPIDITFKFYGLALMRSKLNLSCICNSFLRSYINMINMININIVRKFHILMKTTIKYLNTTMKMSFCNTRALRAIEVTIVWSKNNLKRNSRAKESSKLKVVWWSYWRCHVQEGWKLKQDALKESKKQNWKIARNNTLENIENWQEAKLKDTNNSWTFIYKEKKMKMQGLRLHELILDLKLSSLQIA